MSINIILYLICFSTNFLTTLFRLLYIYILISVNVRLSYCFRASLLWMLSSLFISIIDCIFYQNLEQLALILDVAGLLYLSHFIHISFLNFFFHTLACCFDHTQSCCVCNWRESGKWGVYYTSPQSIIITFSYLSA